MQEGLFIAAGAGHVKYADGMGQGREKPSPEGLAGNGYFQTDLSASQRWPLNSLASASTEPLSSLGSPPSSSPAASSVRFSLGPALSSVVVIAGLEIHSISRSEAPGLSVETSAVISRLSVRPSAG